MIFQRVRWRRGPVYEASGNMAPGLTIDEMLVPHRAERSENDKGTDA